MKREISLLYIASVAFLPGVKPQGGQLGSPCPSDPTVNGFTSIEAINARIQDELNFFSLGVLPNPPYVFTLCPQTILTTDETLTTLLDGSIFRCGRNGFSEDDCVVQKMDSNNTAPMVLFQDSTVNNYDIRTVEFRGVTFRNFEGGPCVAAYASSLSTLTFDDCIWEDFLRRPILDLSNPNGNVPMTVIVESSAVRNGFGVEDTSVLFSNSGGVLRVESIAVSGVSYGTLIQTDLGGDSTLVNSIMGNSVLLSIADVLTGSSQVAEGIEVFGLQAVDSLFQVSSGSFLTLDGADIYDNADPIGSWNCIRASDQSTATVSAIRVFDNEGLRFGVQSDLSSTVSLTGSEFFRNNRVSQDFGAMAAALDGSSLGLSNVRFEDNVGYAAIVFTLFEAFVAMETVCIVGGQAIVPIFVDETSAYSTSNIFSQNVDSLLCDTPDTSPLFVESDGSLCFEADDCEGTCQPVVDLTSCPLDGTQPPVPAPTETPNATPTMNPTLRPTASPGRPTQKSSPGPSPTRSVRSKEKTSRRSRGGNIFSRSAGSRSSKSMKSSKSGRSSSKSMGKGKGSSSSIKGRTGSSSSSKSGKSSSKSGKGKGGKGRRKGRNRSGMSLVGIF